MKKAIIILIALNFLAVACEDKGTLSVFYIKNVSSHSVKLTIFNAELQSLGTYKDTTYIIPIQSEINNSVLMKGNDDYSYFPFGGSADSSYIIFDDSLRIVYKRDDLNNRNILLTKNFTGGGKKKGLFEYYYTITDEDFQVSKKIQ